jgi:hypothetical protein
MRSLLPDEVPTPTARDFFEHPIRKMLREVAYHGTGGLPSDSEIDQLDLDQEHHDRLVRACKRLETAHDDCRADGYMEPAWVLADELSVSVIAELPNRMKTRSFWDRDPGADLTDPGDLAKHIRARH